MSTHFSALLVVFQNGLVILLIKYLTVDKILQLVQSIYVNVTNCWFKSHLRLLTFDVKTISVTSCWCQSALTLLTLMSKLFNFLTVILSKRFRMSYWWSRNRLRPFTVNYDNATNHISIRRYQSSLTTHCWCQSGERFPPSRQESGIRPGFCWLRPSGRSVGRLGHLGWLVALDGPERYRESMRWVLKYLSLNTVMKMCREIGLSGMIGRSGCPSTLCEKYAVRGRQVWVLLQICVGLCSLQR